MRVTILASGSDGNATLFSSRGTRVLVDAGLGPRVLAEAMIAHLGDAHLDAVVITHAHKDHVGHAARLAKKLHVPLYMTEATQRAVPMPSTVTVRRYSPREPFAIGALTFAPLPLPHDAAQVALRVDDGAGTATLATDLGEVTGQLHDHASTSDLLLLESNHDVDLLMDGPYPSFLKRRISSSRGHLSNAQTHGLLRRLATRTRTVVLMHLSRTNNRIDVALESARDALSGRDVALHVAPPRGALSLEVTAARSLRQMSLFTL